MAIRSYQPGDEAAQVSIYNESAAELPRFKPATLDEWRRRSRAADFDPTARFFATEGGRVVGYAAFRSNGRVSFPWCRKGHEGHAEPLFDALLDAMTRRGLTRAFAAYRGDWPAQCEFFTAHGFRRVREMVNYVLNLADMPTPAATPQTTVTPLRPEDVPAVYALAPEALRAASPAELGAALLENPQFGPESVFVLRGRGGDEPVAVGVLVENSSYADPGQLDAAMPCYRLGAFGTEGMQTKRVNGLFSFLTRPTASVTPLALDLLGQAAFRLRDTDVETFAAQVPSDVPHLHRFYEQYFRRQGSFPVFERELKMG